MEIGYQHSGNIKCKHMFVNGVYLSCIQIVMIIIYFIYRTCVFSVKTCALDARNLWASYSQVVCHLVRWIACKIETLDEQRRHVIVHSKPLLYQIDCLKHQRLTSRLLQPFISYSASNPPSYPTWLY